jgi:AcrR family transcriptional regulator
VSAPRRDELIDAGLDYMESVGWDAFTLDEMALALNVELSLVLDYFPSREHLASAFIERMLNALPGAVADEITAEATLRERLYAMLAYELRAMEGRREMVRGLMSSAFSLLSPVAALQLPSVLRFLGFVGEHVRNAKRKGEIGALVMPNIAAASFWLVHLRVLGYWLGDTSQQSEQSHAFADSWTIRYVSLLGGRAPAWQAPPEPSAWKPPAGSL